MTGFKSINLSRRLPGWGGGVGRHVNVQSKCTTLCSGASIGLSMPIFYCCFWATSTMPCETQLSLCLAHVLLLRIARWPRPVPDDWLAPFWSCDVWLLDSHQEIFAGCSGGDAVVALASSIGAISERSPCLGRSYLMLCLGFVLPGRWCPRLTLSCHVR